MPNPQYDLVRDQAFRLDPQDQLALIEDLTRKFRESYTPPERKPFRSLRGVLKHLGPAPSAEDIDEARREAWANFPREDIA